VFAEVRQRASTSHGGAAASVSATKQRRIIFAARHYLMRLGAPPPCRFDVVVVEPRACNGSKGHSTQADPRPTAGLKRLVTPLGRGFRHGGYHQRPCLSNASNSISSTAPT
jgi:Holliday junction resolvase-like predicted endonuclease